MVNGRFFQNGLSLMISSNSFRRSKRPEPKSQSPQDSLFDLFGQADRAIPDSKNDVAALNISLDIAQSQRTRMREASNLNHFVARSR